MHATIQYERDYTDGWRARKAGVVANKQIPGPYLKGWTDCAIRLQSCPDRFARFYWGPGITGPTEREARADGRIQIRVVDVPDGWPVYDVDRW